MTIATRLTEPLMDTAAFLDWTRGTEERWELDRGIPVQMQSERAGHNRAKRRCANTLEQAVSKAGAPCEVFADGMDVVLDDSVYVPDAMLRCGGTMDDDATRVSDPMVIVEVLSPSNSQIEMTTKIDGYFSLPSVAWVLLVNTVTRVVYSYARGEDALILRRHAPGETLTLDPPGIVLAADDLLPLPEEPAPEA